MSPRTLVIVGGVAGGASAAARARRLSEEANIIVYERGSHVSFANCGLPYFVGGEIDARDSLLLHNPITLRARFNLDVRVRTEVVAIDRQRKCVTVRDLDSGREYAHSYDALILSPGSVPIAPPIPGIDRPGHFTVRNVPDVEAISRWLRESGAQRAVVVGAGYIGLEMTEQLKRRDLEVVVVEALPQVMGPFDPEMAAVLQEELRAHGVDLILNDPVAAFESSSPSERALASVVALKSGRRLPADMVVLALGVRPEIGLARSAGLEIGNLGGIRVNEHLQTSDPAIWAVGDAIEARDLVTGEWTLLPLAGPASRQGRVAADNVFGRRSRYEGALGTSIVRVFDMVAACTGASEKCLRRAGVSYEALHLHPPSHASYYPGAAPVALKILFDSVSGRLLGAQAVGCNGVDKRIDVLATAMKARMTVNDLAELDLAYAPPFGSAKDPVNLAGMAAQNVLQGGVRQIQWHQLADVDPVNTVFLDVRSAEERASGYIPGSVHIPLPELRNRFAELPREKELVIYCESGQRSYYACRFLAQHGYSVRNLSGSFKTWKQGQTVGGAF